LSTLLPVADALAQVLAAAGPIEDTLDLPLADALGRVLAVDIISPIDVPADDNSAMDGYALRATDATRALPVSQRIPAGVAGAPLEPGTAARIFTGAPVPPGADAVVMQENCTEQAGRVTVTGEVVPGQNIRARGQDLARGATVLARGRVLRPQDLGLLASVGCARVTVRRPLRVGIIATGDELVEPGSGALAPGQVYNSNRYLLQGLLRRLRLEVLDGGIVRDDPDQTRAALARAAADCDCVITCGGVSVGEEDHVRDQVVRLGRLDLWQLALKPGKPLAFGAIGETPFIGLPGNPTSVFVTFCLIARPFLLKLQGAAEPEFTPRQIPARAAFSTKPGRRQEYLRVSLAISCAGLEAVPYPNQSSGVLSSVARSDALAVIPPGVAVAEGDMVLVILLDSLI